MTAQLKQYALGALGSMSMAGSMKMAGSAGPTSITRKKDKSLVPPVKKTSKQKQQISKLSTMRLKMEDHIRFLDKPNYISVIEAQRHLTKAERIVFETILFDDGTKEKEIHAIQKYPQRSPQWIQSRLGRITGSIASAAVGHHRYERVLKKAKEQVYGSTFYGNASSQHGIDSETPAAQSYINDLLVHVTAHFREQRNQIGVGMTSFEFRGQSIPVLDIYQDPVVEIGNYGLLADYWREWRAMSPDGIVFINGLAVGCIEIKCPYMKQVTNLYENWRIYYYDQIQFELYIANLYWPTIQWIDAVVWSPKHFTVNQFVFDADYFFDWYLPRELKYYFDGYLPFETDRLKTILQIHIDQNPDKFKTEQDYDVAFRAIVAKEMKRSA